jgi:hypothetical protein
MSFNPREKTAQEHVDSGAFNPAIYLDLNGDLRSAYSTSDPYTEGDLANATSHFLTYGYGEFNRRIFPAGHIYNFDYPTVEPCGGSVASYGEARFWLSYILYDKYALQTGLGTYGVGVEGPVAYMRVGHVLLGKGHDYGESYPGIEDWESPSYETNTGVVYDYWVGWFLHDTSRIPFEWVNNYTATEAAQVAAQSPTSMMSSKSYSAGSYVRSEGRIWQAQEDLMSAEEWINSADPNRTYDDQNDWINGLQQTGRPANLPVLYVPPPIIIATPWTNVGPAMAGLATSFGGNENNVLARWEKLVWDDDYTPQVNPTHNDLWGSWLQSTSGDWRWNNNNYKYRGPQLVRAWMASAGAAEPTIRWPAQHYGITSEIQIPIKDSKYTIDRNNPETYDGSQWPGLTMSGSSSGVTYQDCQYPYDSNGDLLENAASFGTFKCRGNTIQSYWFNGLQTTSDDINFVFDSPDWGGDTYTKGAMIGYISKNIAGSNTIDVDNLTAYDAAVMIDLASHADAQPGDPNNPLHMMAALGSSVPNTRPVTPAFIGIYELQKNV